jgi:hypothetical protein
VLLCKPIDMYWICQGPWFQCWVLWRKADTNPTAGHVTVLITTPAAAGYPLNKKITRTGQDARQPEYACPPPYNARTRERGMWVVGHEDYVATPIPTTRRSRRGTATTEPTLRWESEEPVVCVVPAEKDGGVLSNGRLYIP